MLVPAALPGSIQDEGTCGVLIGPGSIQTNELRMYVSFGIIREMTACDYTHIIQYTRLSRH